MARWNWRVRDRRWLVALAVVSALQPSHGTRVALAAAARSRVHVQVVGEDGRPVAARVYLLRGTEPIPPAGFPAYDRGGERHVLVTGEFDLDLDPGTYRLRVERGLEYVPAEAVFDVPAGAPVSVTLRRWADMNREGWYSADMHVHRDPADVPLILRAEDLNFVPTITTHVWSTEASQPWKAPTALVQDVEPGRFFTGSSQEIERIQGGPGAVILMGRGLPIPFTGYELYPPAATYARAVHAQGGFVEGDKPFWVDTLVNAALGHLDAIEINCNHFLPREVDTDLAAWSHWPIEFGYRGTRGFALWMMDLYYRLLNSGIELPLSAGSANGVKATPAGYDRVYVRPEGPLDYDSFMAALRRGRTFSTNGPVLELDVDGRFGPGDRIALEPGHEYRVRARARSRDALESLQLVVNGAVSAEQAGGEQARELSLDRTVRVDRSTWLAVRAFERTAARQAWEPGPQVFAHTSPVYLLRDRQPVVVADSVRDLLQKIDTLIAHTEKLDGFRQERDRTDTIDLYRSARDLLRARVRR